VKVVGVLQARTGSSRLPGKVLAPVLGKPMVERMLERVGRAQRLDELVVALPAGPADDALAAVAAAAGAQVTRGPEDDVLGRFAGAVAGRDADAVVRLTADCPLHDPALIDAAVDAFTAMGCDYLSNTLDPTYPDGLDVEVFTAEALARADAEATLPHQREHVTPYLHGDGFTARSFSGAADFSHLRWTVDEPADLAFVREVYAALYPENPAFSWLDVLALVTSRPELGSVNAGIARNEGLARSLAAESPRSIARSLELRERARVVIPSGTQTFSKGTTQFVQGVAPVYLERAQGSRVWDVDGNEYVDYAMGLGPIILGHDHPAVTEAVVRQARRGVSLSLPHPLEVELAERLVDLLPCAEMVRFGKNGSDVTSGAVRAARAFTGRDLVACSGYHGWQDWFIGTTTRNKGVPEAVQGLTKTFAYNDLASLERLFAEHPGQIACVVMEPAGAAMPQPGYLEAVRELTRREGALLVFDEVITGFRFALGGAQELFGVTPDLACVGKAMANGYPLSAVVGRRDVMEIFDEIFFSFTFGGEAVSLAASLATIGELERLGLAQLWEQGAVLQDGLTALAAEHGLADRVQCVGPSVRTIVAFKAEDGTEDLHAKSVFQQECVKRGVLFPGYHNMTFSHTDEDVAHTLAVYRAALQALAAGAPLEGAPVEPVFRRP